MSLVDENKEYRKNTELIACKKNSLERVDRFEIDILDWDRQTKWVNNAGYKDKTYSVRYCQEEDKTSQILGLQNTKRKAGKTYLEDQDKDGHTMKVMKHFRY